MFCCTLLYVNSSFAIILMGKRKLVALLSKFVLFFFFFLFFFWGVVWLFLVVPWLFLLSAVCDCGISLSYSLTIFR